MTLEFGRRSALHLLGGVALLPSLPAWGQASETDRLNEFFEQVFQRNVARSPIRQARLGIRTNQDKWDDISEAHQEETASLLRGDLEKLRSFDVAKLTPQAVLSYRLFEQLGNDQLARFAWRRSEYLVTQMGGMHRRVATVLLNDHQIKERKDAEAYVARLRGVKPLLAQLVVELERQEKAGVKPPRFVFPMTIGECSALIAGAPFDASGKDSPLFADFKSKLTKTDWPDADKAALTAQAETALRENVGPAYRALIAHLQNAEKSATDEDGVWKLPQGGDFYRTMLQSYTTLPVTADELHQLGLREVKRIHDDIRAIMRTVGFDGTLQQFFEKVRNDKSLYYPDSDEGRADYLRDATARLEEVQSRAGTVLGLQPKAPVVVRAVEKWREKAAAKAFYASPPEDGAQPGIFYVNLYDMQAAPKYVLPVQLYHEAIPGHHVETVVSQELRGLPKFRKYASIAAYSEGWGLYSERFAKEMGLYRTPYEDLGRLSLELMRAGRLVVDTGLHAKRWTRTQAVTWFDENLPSTHYDNQREIDRYIVLPGQAVSYEVGMLKIVELRARAEKALGAKFDLRGFHDVVLGGGPLPLPMLEQAVDSWIAEHRA